MRRPFGNNGIGVGTWLDRPHHDKHYPDILIPIELKPHGFTITRGQSQMVWLDVYISSDTYINPAYITDRLKFLQILDLSNVCHYS